MDLLIWLDLDSEASNDSQKKARRPRSFCSRCCVSFAVRSVSRLESDLCSAIAMSIMRLYVFAWGTRGMNEATTSIVFY